MTGDGFVIKKDGVGFPNALIKSYENTPDRRQDKGSYTNSKGSTKRSILPIKRTTAVLETVDRLTYGEKLIIQAFFSNRDNVVIDAWNDERNIYQKVKCYVPDVTYRIDFIDNKGNFYYNSLKIEFIDYGGEA